MKLPKFPPKASAQADDVLQNRQRALHYGAYASVLAVALLVVLILANLVVQALPVGMTRFDISSGRMFTLSDTTRELLAGLEEDVTAYYLAQTGYEDANVTQLLDRYAGQSRHFHWEQRDPALYPALAQQYEASEGSVVLLCGDGKAVVEYNTMYEIEYGEDFYTTGAYTQSFAAENAITSGIARALRKVTCPLYQITGHGEYELGENNIATLQNGGVTVQDLNLAAAGGIPEDTAILLINAPQVDYTADDIDAVRGYLQSGGKVLVTTDVGFDTPNLDGLLAEYGLVRQPGLLIEGDMNRCYYGYPHYLLPQVYPTEISAGMADGVSVYVPLAHGILIESTETYLYYALMGTSSQSYSLLDYATAENLAQGPDDPSGPFNVAVAVADAQSDAKLIWIGSGSALLDDADLYGGNGQLLGSMAAWLTGEQAGTIIAARSMSGTLLEVPVALAIALGILFVLVLPAGAIVFGAVRCALRRRR